MSKLEALRSSMRLHRIDAIIIPSSDPHQSEYVAAHWKDREYISGFTGSAGLCVVSQDEALLWTDSRYFLQAEMELEGSGFRLQKLTNQFAPEHIEWIKSKFPNGATVAIDAFDFSVNQFRMLNKELEKVNIFLETSLDLMSEVWIDRPSLSKAPISIQDITFAGAGILDKISEVKKKMLEVGSDHYLVTALDDIAWLLNIRGQDVAFNPVVVSFVCVNLKETHFFVDTEKIDSSVESHLRAAGIIIHGYDEISAFLNSLAEDDTLLLDANECNVKLQKAINCRIQEKESLIKHLKCIKNNTELESIRAAMVKDGVALANAFYWLEQTLPFRPVSEAEFGSVIGSQRAKQENYVGESFAAIVGYGPNGAIIHYHPTEANCAMIRNEGVLLCDCGAQYKEGTTDITRTIALSKPTDTIKRHFTLVLKGHIGINLSVFPDGTAGAQIDILARQHLWEEGLNYQHGTGHGVGAYLNVHEGPQGIAAINTERGRTALRPGMVTSNEPGYYLDGFYGIRIENLVVTKVHLQHHGFLCFEVLSLYPLDFDLIYETMLSGKEKLWLNKYQSEVYERIHPFLSDEVKTWFKFKCRVFN